MQFLILGYDGKDADAPQRRQQHRCAHLNKVAEMVKLGHHLYACAMLDAEEQMIGSMLVTEFASKDELEAYLEQEPYMIGKVWEKIEIIPCSVPSLFIQK